MSFDDMPELGEFLRPEAVTYSERVTAMSREVVDRSRTVIDVPYGSDFFQKLDIYLPDDAEELEGLPVLLFFHGGGWANGYKEWLGFMAPVFTSLPAVFISGNYRLAPQAKFPRPMEDVASAVRWVRERIGEYGGDPDRIFVGGHSAGGHLASLVALRHDVKEQAGLSADSIRACFPVSAAYTFRSGDLWPKSDRHVYAERLLSDASQEGPASPLEHVDSNRTPFLVAFGSADFPELKDQAKKFISALQAQPGYVEGLELVGCDHYETSAGCHDPENDWVKIVRSWMEAEPDAMSWPSGGGRKSALEGEVGSR